MSDLVLHQKDEGEIQAYLTFRVGIQWYGVEVLSIYEVYNLVAISPVPDMPESVLGVVNIRGAVVPIIDLRIRFKSPDSELKLSNPIIFLHDNYKNTYGIIVDDVDDVINLSPSMISKSALNQRAPHIMGLTDYRSRLIMLLNPIQLLFSTLEDQEIEHLLHDSDQQE